MIIAMGLVSGSITAQSALDISDPVMSDEVWTPKKMGARNGGEKPAKKGKGLSHTKASIIQYSESFTQFNSYCPGSPQVDNWEAFRAELDTCITFSQVKVYGSENPGGVTCADSAIVNGISRAMFLGGNYGPITCNGKKWFVQSNICKTGCTNALPGVELTIMDDNPGGCLCYGPVLNPSAMTVRPTISNSNWGGLGDTTCFGVTQTMTVEFTKHTNSRDFTLTPAASEFCPESTLSTTLEQSGSAVGFNYTLHNADTDAQIDGPKAGTGGALTFNSGVLSATTNFIIKEDGVPLSCTIATISQADTQDPNITACANLNLTLDVNGTASIDVAEYQVTGTNTFGISDNCGVDTATFSQVNFDCSDIGTNVVQYTVTDNAGNTTSCFISVTVSTYLTEQNASASNANSCVGSSETIDLDDSQTGVNYFLRDNSDNSVIDGPVAGTGNAISLNTGTFSSAGTITYNILAVLAADNGCSLVLADKPSITVIVCNVDPVLKDENGSATVFIADQEICRDSNSGALAFQVTDDDGDAVTVSGTSDNQTLIPNANIVVDPSGTTQVDRTVTITPAVGVEGTAQITITADDGEGGSDVATFNVTVALCGKLIINEVDYDQPGTDDSEFIEIVNAGEQWVNLDVVTLELVDGAGPSVYATLDLPDFDLAPGAYYVVCANPFKIADCDFDVTPNTDLIQNGSPDAIVLKRNGIAEDKVSYGGTVTGSVEGTGTTAIDVDTDENRSLSRIPNATDTDNNDADFSLACATPGSANALPPAKPTIAAQGPTTFCGGESVVLQATAELGVTYRWIKDGTVIAPETSSSLEVWQSGDYVVEVSKGGCAVASDAVTISVQEPQEVSFTHVSHQCLENEPVTLSGGTPTGGQFFIDGVGGTTFDPAGLGIGTHQVRYVTDQGICGTRESEQIVEVNAHPQVSTTATDPLCIDGTLDLLNHVSPGDGVFNGTGVTGSILDASVAGVGNHSIDYTRTNVHGCSTTDQVEVEIVVLPLVSIDPLPQRCENEGAVTLSGSPVGGDFSGTGVTGDLFDPATAGPGTHPIIYTYTDANGCSNADQTDQIVVEIVSLQLTSVQPICIDAPPFSLEGTVQPTGGNYSGPGVSFNLSGNFFEFDPASAGAGVHAILYEHQDGNNCLTSLNFNIEVLSAPTPDFTLSQPWFCRDQEPVELTGSPAGGTFSGQGVTEDNGQFFLEPGFTVDSFFDIFYEVTVNGCSNTVSQQVEVRDPEQANVQVSQNPVCETEIVAMNLVSTNPVQIQWLRDGNPVPGAQSSELQVQTPGSYQVSYFDGSCPVISSPIQVDFLTLPDPVIMAIGGTSFCTGESVKLQTTEMFSAYQWKRDGIDVPGATSHQIVADEPGVYSVWVQNEAGCSAESDGLDMQSSTSAGLFAPGGSGFCLGSSTVLETTTGESYKWFRNGVLIDGAVSSTLEVNDAAMYQAMVTDANGCDAMTNTLTTEVFALPVVSLSNPDVVEICDPGFATLSSSDPDFAAYQWYKNGQSIVGATDAQLVVTTPGVYHVVVLDDNGCSALSESVDVVQLDMPPVPVIQRDFDQLFVEVGEGTVQWVLDGQPIPGATELFLTITQNGVYQVVVTLPNGCFAISDGFNYTFVGIAGVVATASNIQLYPNPVNHGFTVDGHKPGDRLTVQDLVGKTVLRQTLKSGPHYVELPPVAPGTYSVRIESGDGTQAFRIIKN